MSTVSALNGLTGVLGTGSEHRKQYKKTVLSGEHDGF